MEQEPTAKQKLPWWTWIAPLPIFILSTRLSHSIVDEQGGLLFLLTIPVSLVLVQWWGPRILISLWINSIIQFQLFSDTEISALYTLHLVAVSLTGWVLFSRILKGEPWLPNLKATIRLTIYGIIIPVTVNALFVYFLDSEENILEYVTMVWTSDFASSFAIVLPTLFYLTPVMERRGLTLTKGSTSFSPVVINHQIRPHLTEIIISVTALIVLAYTLPTDKYWYLYGVFVLYIGVRYGFSNSLLANLVVFILVYVVPFILPPFRNLATFVMDYQISVNLGMCLLSVSGSIIGRVISDLRITEQKLNNQNRELEHTNEELDRFVYSASHDLSAPLKSLLGLVNLGKIEKDHSQCFFYFEQMQRSVLKLERFINEILDYSRNSRLDLSPQVVNLRSLIGEVLEDLRFMEGFSQVRIKLDALCINEIHVDPMRMRIILNNLISNAIKYKRSDIRHQPLIEVSSDRGAHEVLIKVKDNGQGIRPDIVPKVFNMFFKANVNSTGSGLGLYIAQETASRMGGKIFIESTEGEGSVFTVRMPVQYVSSGEFDSHNLSHDSKEG